MATVVLRPSSTVTFSVGNFKNQSGLSVLSVHSQTSDEDNSTYIYNYTANQGFIVELDDTSGLSGATFNNFVVTAIFQKHGGKGASAKFDVRIGDSSSSTTFGGPQTFATTNATPTTISGASINFGGSVSDSDVDGMRIQVDTTSNTQVRLFELYVTVDYTAAASGYGNDINGVTSANIGKVDGVATANIEKVIGV